MVIEAGVRRKIAISIIVIGMFIALVVGTSATCNQDGPVSTGGLVLVGAITAFILVAAGIGVWLSRSS